MNEATLLAIYGGIPTIIVAITGLLIAVRGNNTAKAAAASAKVAASSLEDHVIKSDKLN